MPAAITLSLGGVNFCLTPNLDHKSQDASDAVMSVSNMCEDEIVINLNKFVGTLRVSQSSSHDGRDNTDTKDALLATEELSQSNESTSCAKTGLEAAIVHESEEIVAPKLNKSRSNDNVTKGFDIANDKEMPLTQRSVAVEDTPSPDLTKAKSIPKKKGQQKLNFTSRRDPRSKSEDEDDVTDDQKKVSNSAPKRSTSDVSSQNRKKSRKHDNTDKEEAPSEASDVIFESKSSSEAGQLDEKEQVFGFASLGQSMPSQATDSSPSLDQLNDEEEYVDAKAVEGEVIRSNYSFSMEEYSRDSFGDDFFTSNKGVDGEEHNEDGSCSMLGATDSLINAKPTSTAIVPAARWGHTMEMISHSKIILYGGQTIDPETNQAKIIGDIKVYDIIDHKWTEPINCTGVPRTWHSSNFLPDRQLLLCFGGDVVDEATGKTETTDQVMVLDTDIMLWYPPSVTGTAPKSRSGHTASLLHTSNELVVFGGVCNGKWTNTVSILETTRWHWTSPKISGDAPRSRSYHSATAVGDCIVYFGGNNGTQCFNTVHVLESKGGDKWAWSHPKVGGKAPSPRTGHIATLMDDNSTILIYGGWDPNMEDDKGEDVIFGDSFLLDTITWTWRKGPRPRFVGDSKMTTNNGAIRVGHSAVLAPGFEGAEVLTFGGRLPENKFGADFQKLVVPKREAVPSRIRSRQR